MHPPHTARQGILLVIVATACFGALDTLSKYISNAVPLVMAIWSRYLFQALVTGGALLPRRGRALLRTQHPWLQVARGALLAVQGALAFLSLRHMPVGEFTAIVMLTPMLITVLSATALGERVPALRWGLLAGCFAGAMMVIRPGAEDFRWTLLLPLALVVVAALFQLLTSWLARVDDPGTMHFYTGLVATVLATLALPFGWQPPRDAQMWLMLGLLGVFSTLGHYLLILGYGRASPATLTPYLYCQIAFATLAGWLVFAHAPDGWTIAGIAVIALCGSAGTWLTARRAARAPARR